MSAASRLERRQIPIYLGALLVGAGIGLAMPGVAPVLELGIYPVLGAMLYATFSRCRSPR